MSFVEGGIGTDTQAQLATADTPLWFFVEDFHNSQGEASLGKVNHIQIWDGALR